MASSGSFSSTRPSAAACRSPSAFRGMSMWPCSRLSTFQSVSPWRISRISSMSLFFYLFTWRGDSSADQRRVQCIRTGDTGLRQHVALQRIVHVGAGEFAGDGQLLLIHRIQRKNVTVHDRVVPWRTRAVIAEVIATHVAVAGKPAGVIVETMARARQWIAWNRRTGLAACGNGTAELACSQLADACRDIHQAPVEKIDTRQIGRHGLAFLVDVVTARRHVGIMHDQ